MIAGARPWLRAILSSFRLILHLCWLRIFHGAGGRLHTSSVFKLRFRRFLCLAPLYFGLIQSIISISSHEQPWYETTYKCDLNGIVHREYLWFGSHHIGVLYVDMLVGEC